MTGDLSASEAAPAIIQFWFDAVGKDCWFVKDTGLDTEIRKRFGKARDALLASRARGWRDTPEHILAAILLLDQCSRNIHRGRARAYAGDALALELAKLALDRGWTHAAPVEWRQFLLLPLQHSENLADQERSVAEYQRLGEQEALNYAQLHLNQIRRFGRFPGRNQALGRVSTAEEREVIALGETF